MKPRGKPPVLAEQTIRRLELREALLWARVHGSTTPEGFYRRRGMIAVLEWLTGDGPHPLPDYVANTQNRPAK